MATSRTQAAIKNMRSALISKAVSLMVKFALRTVFVYNLSSIYLGIDSLLSGILMVLSLADLGLDIALPSRLYALLKEQDFANIKRYMDFYKKVYIWISGTTLLLGVIIYPLLPYVIHQDGLIENLTEIYALYVINAAISYICAYKRTLMIADQKGYVVNNIVCIMQVMMALCQAVALIIWHSFIGYLMLAILLNLCQNIYISKVCTEEYPQLYNYSCSQISRDEVRKLGKDVLALFVYRVATILEVSIAAILGSYFVGVYLLGLVSNYSLIIQSLAGVLMLVFSSITAGIGSAIVSKDNDEV